MKEIDNYIENESNNTKSNNSDGFPFSPFDHIVVFISSKCGGKYDDVRANIKSKLENTGIIRVYEFEEQGASILSAEKHFSHHLKASDVCIFLIDNSDGITEGVQKEIDIVEKNNIKSIYLFCDENEKKKTKLEENLTGSTHSKTKTVHQFNELNNWATDSLINSLVDIFKKYCKGELIEQTDDKERIQTIDIETKTSNIFPSAPKIVINKIDKCRDYIAELTLGTPVVNNKQNEIKTSKIDEWGQQFLSIMFEGQSIKNFNTSMFLEDIKKIQEKNYFEVVTLRWNAIQSFFIGDIMECIKTLKDALDHAKKTNQPSWVIQDILIDLRNLQTTVNIINNKDDRSTAQEELDNYYEYAYYPVLDRVYQSLQSKYIEGLYKNKIRSPYSVTFGNSINQYCSLISSLFVASLFNGSLTHIMFFYERMRDFNFYLCSIYNNWQFRKNLLKLTIFLGDLNDVVGIKDNYPEVLNKLNHSDAAEIVAFCDNHPIHYQRFRSQLLALSIVGYYLDDAEYENIENKLVLKIREWLNDDNAIVDVGKYIFKFLTGVCQRASQDLLAEICCIFIEKNLNRWFTDIFEFMAKCIDINKMENESVGVLIQHIINVIENKNTRLQILNAPKFLIIFRNQNRELTKELDSMIESFLPEFYNGIYKLGTTLEKQKVYTEHLKKCTNSIRTRNLAQYEDKFFFGDSINHIVISRNLLLQQDVIFNDSIIDELIEVLSDTLLSPKEDINYKIDAISLLICLLLKHRSSLSRNKDIFDRIILESEKIKDTKNYLISSNIEVVSLEISLALLNSTIGGDGYNDFLNGLSYIQSNKTTVLIILKLLNEYLEISDDIIFPKCFNPVIIQNILQWLQNDNLDIRWYSTRLLLMLGRVQENEIIINRKLLNLIDSESISIKILILQRLYKSKGIYSSTKDYIVSKCMNDPCFLVRKVCKEISQ